jgi:hypothetical protein
MQRVFNSKYRIILVSHERQESKWVIPPNEGFYIPIVLWQFLERQYGATHGLDETIRQMQFTEKQREEQRNQDFDWDDTVSVSSFATSVSQQSTSRHEDEEESQRRNHIDVTIQLYFPEYSFTSFCSWAQLRSDESVCDAQNVYPVFMKWCGIPLEDYFYSNYQEPLWEGSKLPGLLSKIESNISALNALRPSSSGSIGCRDGSKIGPGWGRVLNEQQNTSDKLPLVLFYKKKFIQAVKSILNKNPNYNGEVTVPSSSHLMEIPLLKKVSHESFNAFIMFNPRIDYSRDENYSNNPSYDWCRLFQSHEGCFSISKALVELDYALGHLDILCDATGPAEIPKSVQLFMDNIVLSKQIPIQEAQRRCFVEFDVDDEFWKDIEQQVEKTQWEELKKIHYQHVEKRQKLNVKRPLEKFMDAFPVDEDWKMKMLVRLKISYIN